MFSVNAYKNGRQLGNFFVIPNTTRFVYPYFKNFRKTPVNVIVHGLEWKGKYYIPRKFHKWQEQVRGNEYEFCTDCILYEDRQNLCVGSWFNYSQAQRETLVMTEFDRNVEANWYKFGTDTEGTVDARHGKALFEGNYGPKFIGPKGTPQNPTVKWTGEWVVQHDDCIGCIPHESTGNDKLPEFVTKVGKWGARNCLLCDSLWISNSEESQECPVADATLILFNFSLVAYCRIGHFGS